MGKENKKDWMWLTVFYMAPLSAIVKSLKMSTSPCKNLAPDVVFLKLRRVLKCTLASGFSGIRQYVLRKIAKRGGKRRVWSYSRHLEAINNCCVICFPALRYTNRPLRITLETRHVIDYYTNLTICLHTWSHKHKQT